MNKEDYQALFFIWTPEPDSFHTQNWREKKIQTLNLHPNPIMSTSSYMWLFLKWRGKQVLPWSSSLLKTNFLIFSAPPVKHRKHAYFIICFYLVCSFCSQPTTIKETPLTTLHLGHPLTMRKAIKEEDDINYREKKRRANMKDVDLIITLYLYKSIYIFC